MSFKLNDVVVTKTGRIGSITYFKYLHDKQNVLIRYLDDLDLEEIPEKDVVLCYDTGAIAIAKVKGYELLTNGHSLDDLVCHLECRDLDFMLENYHSAVGDMANVFFASQELLKLCKKTPNVPSEIIIAVEALKETCGFSGEDDD